MKHLEQLLQEFDGNHLCIEYMVVMNGYAVEHITIHNDKIDEIPWNGDNHPDRWEIFEDANAWLDICYQDLLSFNKKFNADRHMSDYPAVIYSRETP